MSLLQPAVYVKWKEMSNKGFWNIMFQKIKDKTIGKNAYVLHIKCMDLQHSHKYKHILLDDFWPCIRHFYHMNESSKDLDTFLEHMQGDPGILDQLCIQV